MDHCFNNGQQKVFSEEGQVEPSAPGNANSGARNDDENGTVFRNQMTRGKIELGSSKVYLARAQKIRQLDQLLKWAQNGICEYN